MYSSFAIFRACFLWIAVSDGVYSSLITLQPNNNVPIPGLSYSWIIPPQSQQPSIADPPLPPPDRSPGFDPRNESPIIPIGGYGHPPFYLRHSHEQLSLPNEFLITPANQNNPHQGRGGLVMSSPPIFQQLDPVDCDGGPTCPNVDVTYQPQQHQEHPTAITQQQSNIASVPANTPPSDHHQQQRESASALPSGQPVNWPSSHGGGIGLLFFVPQSASHLPVEQLIRQQLDLHRTQFPFDISINCDDAGGSGSGSGSGCPPVGGGLSAPPTASWNGWNVENVNYASPPLVEIVNTSRRRGSQEHQRKWRTIGERIVRNKQHQNRMVQQMQQQQLQQLQQNQRELSILP